MLFSGEAVHEKSSVAIPIQTKGLIFPVKKIISYSFNRSVRTFSPFAL